jgi:hypothetical protein
MQKLENKKLYEVVNRWELDNLDRQILKHLAAYPTTKLKDLGKIIGFSASQVKRRIGRPAFQRALDEINATTEKHLQEAARRAAIKLKKWVDSDDPEIAEPYIKMALSPYLNRSTVDLRVEPVVRYKTMITNEGHLIQEIVKETLLQDDDNIIEAQVSNGG